MIKPPKVAAYISLPELGQPKPTLRDVVQIAKTINRSAGLTVLGQMNLFLGAASIKQDLEKDADARWKAQEHLIRTTVSDLRLKILKAKLFKALLRDRVVFHRSQLLAAIKLVALFGEPVRGNMLAARDDFGVLTELALAINSLSEFDPLPSGSLGAREMAAQLAPSRELENLPRLDNSLVRSRRMLGDILKKKQWMPLAKELEQLFVFLTNGLSFDAFRDILNSRMTFAGVRIVTVSEGDIGHLHVGLKGTMNALYLHDLAEKTRRGLRGRVEVGRSGGGISYGYRVVRAPEGQPRGEREIHAGEAVTVQRIFRAFVAGVSPKAIAKALNAEGDSWANGRGVEPQHDSRTRGPGTGILNNELYLGRLIWNRQRYVKDPDTGKRLARINPPEAWVITNVPLLKILDKDLWQAAKARQESTRRTMKAGIVRARRPKYLFSGLTQCEACGGGFVLSSHDHLVCFNARSRGTCANRRSIKRQEVEARVPRAMRERFFEPGAFAAFCEGFAAEMTLQRREHLAQLAGARRELAAAERRLKEILNALAEGYRCESWKAELVTLDAQKAALTLAVAEPQLPALHPRMAEVFRQKATTLAAGLEHDEQRDAARQALRGFLEKITIPPGDGLLQVVGNVGSMLAAAQGRQSGSATVGYVGCGAPQPIFQLSADKRLTIGRGSRALRRPFVRTDRPSRIERKMSSMTRIAVDLPEDIAKRLESAWRDVSRGTLEAVALEGYRDGTLSREQVGRVLGLSFWETEAFLKERQAYLAYDEQDLEHDRRDLDRLGSR